MDNGSTVGHHEFALVTVGGAAWLLAESVDV